MVQGCQTCLRVISDPSKATDINSPSSTSDGMTLKEKLLDCVSELVLDSVQNAVMCASCVDVLTYMCQFKQQCLEAQKKIHGYLQQMPLNTDLNLGEIAMYYHRLNVAAAGGESLTKYTPVVRNTIRRQTKMPQNCKLCGFSCIDKCAIRLHLIVHQSKDAPYKCDECTYIFPNQTLLLDHLASHTNERPYSCTLCDFVTAVHDELKDHGKVHRRTFQCNMCWMRFSDRGKLEAHLDVHNNEEDAKKYQCGWCDYKTDQVKNLNSHLNNNHQETYNCNACSTKCRTRDGLARHKKRVHGKMEKYLNETAVSVSHNFPIFQGLAISRTIDTILAKNTFQCPLCPFFTASRNLWIMHKNALHKKDMIQKAVEQKPKEQILAIDYTAVPKVNNEETKIPLKPPDAAYKNQNKILGSNVGNVSNSNAPVVDRNMAPINVLSDTTINAKPQGLNLKEQRENVTGEGSSSAPGKVQTVPETTEVEPDHKKPKVTQSRRIKRNNRRICISIQRGELIKVKPWECSRKRSRRYRRNVD